MLSNFLRKITSYNKRPIFIIGAPRSGTTWLWGLLTSHPNIISLERTDFDPSNPSIVNGKRLTSETGAFNNYDTKYVMRVIDNKIKSHPQKRVIEKTPTHIRKIKVIFDCYPNAQIIHIKREPQDVISSMLNATFFNFANTVEEALAKYNELMTCFSTHRNDKRIHQLSYEELKSTPETTLHKVFNFLEMDTPSVLLQQIIQENHNRSKVDIKDAHNTGRDSSKKTLINILENITIQKYLCISRCV